MMDPKDKKFPKKEEPPVVEFRQDIISGDWILISSLRQKKPQFFNVQSGKKGIFDKENCPFEDPQKAGNPKPILWLPRPGVHKEEGVFEKDWFTQVIPNKYPLLPNLDKEPTLKRSGIYEKVEAVGHHEVIITRDHDKPFEKMSVEEIATVFETYRQRYKALEKDARVNYILIFHNQGELAGASIPHPHSQLVAMPIVPPDVSRSISGAIEFYEKNRKCGHCSVLVYEQIQKKRIVFKDKNFISLVPYSSKVPYETRVFPLKHSSDFEEVTWDEMLHFAAVFKDALLRLSKVLGKPDYNFFIHTASARVKSVPYYHWHVEILPRTYKWAGMELGTGVESVSFPPEQAARDLRNAFKK